MGTGKSSVGRRLARFQHWPRFDTDAMVAPRTGNADEGNFCRCSGKSDSARKSRRYLEKLDAPRPSIIVTGGGTVLRPQNIARLRELGTVVYLTANLTTLLQTAGSAPDRPLLQTENPAETIETAAARAGTILSMRGRLHDRHFVAHPRRKSLHLFGMPLHSASEIKALLHRRALELGFEDCRIASAASAPHAEAFRALAGGRRRRRDGLD